MLGLLLLSTLHTVLAEWTGLLRVQKTTSDYTNVTLVQETQTAFRGNFGMEVANFTFNASDTKFPLVSSTQLLLREYNSSEGLSAVVSQCTDLGVSYVLLVTDENITYEAVGTDNLTVLTILPDQGKLLLQEVQGLLSSDGEPVSVLFVYYELRKSHLVDCAEFSFVVTVYAGATVVCFKQVWAVFLVIWVCNNSYWNLRHVRFSHKLLTFILVFKAVGVYCSFSLYNSCPFERVTAGLLELVQNQFRTLYETSYLSLFLVLSKGFLVTREIPSRAEFNHLAVLASTVYVTVSAYNIMREQIWLMVLGMYLALWLHCSYYSFGVLRVVAQRLLLSTRNRVPDLISAWRVKKSLFLTFSIIVQVYFVGELLIHAVITDWSFGLLSGYRVMAVNIGVHEVLELVVLGTVFALYRSRSRGPFFEVLGEERAPPRQTTHYLTNYFAPVAEVKGEVGTPVIIVNPGGAWDTQYPFAQATLAFVDSSQPSKRSAFSVQLPGHPPS